MLRKAVALLRKLGYRPSGEADVLPMLLEALEREHAWNEVLRRYLPEPVWKRIRETPGGSLFWGERRQVTVLFVDVCGFTSISEHTDAEIVMMKLNEIFEVIVRAAARHGGFVDKFMGDAALVTFGAPIARGDDVFRALQAAREIVQGIQNLRNNSDRAADAGFQVSIGVNTGGVIAGNMGESGRLEYTVIGDTVNTASRLRDAARPGEIVVSEAVWKRTKDDFQYTPLPDVQAKGKENPLPVYLLGRRIQRAHRAPGAPEAPFVGREDVLRWLNDHLEAAISTSSRMVCLTGAGGTGKTRLVREWLERIKEKPLFIIRLSCYFDDRNTPFQGIRNLFRELAAIDGETHDARLRRRIAAWIRYLGGTRIQQRAVPEKISRAFSSERSTTDGDSGELAFIFDAVVSLVRLATRRRPALIVIDNYQWLDPLTRQCVEWVVANLKEPGSMLLATGRSLPEHIPAVVTDYRVLEGLSPAAAVCLAETLCRMHRISAPPVREIVRRAEYHPLFIELLVKHIHETALLQEKQPMELPPDIESIVRSRIDLLGESAKNVLETASVMGDRISPSLLEKVMEEPPGIRMQGILDELEAMGYLVTMRNGRFLQFRRHLIQEVIYNGILNQRKRALHYRVARAMEAVSGKDAYSPAQIAFHYMNSDHPERALFFLGLAARKANHFYQYEEATRYYEEGLKILEQAGKAVSGEAWRFHYKAGQILHISGNIDGAVRHFTRALEISRQLKEDTKRAEALEKIGDIQVDGGGLKESIPYYSEAIRIYRSVNDIDGESRALDALGIVFTQLGEWSRAESAFRKSLALAQQSANYQLQGMVFTNLGIYHSILGKTHEAIENFMESTKWFEQAGLLEGMAQAYHNLGTTHEKTGNLRQAEYYYERSMEIAREIGDKLMIALTQLNRSHVRMLNGDLMAARALCLQALEQMKQLNYRVGIANAYLTLGRIARREKREKQARGLFALAYRMSRRNQDVMGCAESAREYAVQLAESGRAARANRYFQIAADAYTTLKDQKNLEEIEALRRSLNSA